MECFVAAVVVGAAAVAAGVRVEEQPGCLLWVVVGVVVAGIAGVVVVVGLAG